MLTTMSTVQPSDPLASVTSPRTAPVRDHADAFPGALRPHTSADGALAGVRLVGGLLNSGQAEVLAMVAETMGDGYLDLTSRGDIELRGLQPGAGRELGGWLESCGLLPSRLHERVRNVLASPLAGLDGRGNGSLEELVVALDRSLCESEAATGLPAAFLFALDDGRGDVAHLDADVALRMEDGTGQGAEEDTRDGAGERLGGDAERTALLSLGEATVRIARDDGPAAAVRAAEILLDFAARTEGPRAGRVRELLAAQRPSTSQLRDRLAAHGIAASEPHETELREVSRFPVPAPPAPGFVDGPDGKRSLLVHAPSGRLTVAQWRLLTTHASRLRVTPWRGVVLPALRHPAEHLTTELAEAGLATAPASS